MPQINYNAWAFLSLDSEPTSGEPTSFNPPVITNMAIDYQASLIFQFSALANSLIISIETTTLSAETHQEDSLFSILTGPSPNHYQRCTTPGWDRRPTDSHTVFSTQIERSDTYLKLNYNKRDSLIISKVEFSSP